MDKIYKVEIITRKEKFNALKEALNAIGVQGMTVYDVQGCGVQKGITTYLRGVKTEVTLIPKIKVDIVVCEVPYEKVVETAREVLKTGAVGDGKIFVTELKDVIRIRTGESGADAIRN